MTRMEWVRENDPAGLFCFIEDAAYYPAAILVEQADVRIVCRNGIAVDHTAPWPNDRAYARVGELTSNGRTVYYAYLDGSVYAQSENFAEIFAYVYAEERLRNGGR